MPCEVTSDATALEGTPASHSQTSHRGRARSLAPCLDSASASPFLSVSSSGDGLLGAKVVWPSGAIVAITGLMVSPPRRAPIEKRAGDKRPAERGPGTWPGRGRHADRSTVAARRTRSGGIIARCEQGSVCEHKPLPPPSGRGGIRTHGGLPLAGFQDRCIQPLCHPTGVEKGCWLSAIGRRLFVSRQPTADS